MARQVMRGKELQAAIIDLAHTYGWKDCVLGTGALNHGYHRQMREGVRRDQHVWAWIDRHGPVPDGMIVHHRCENQRCINVNHLALVTKAEHMRIHHARSVCKYGHSRIGNVSKSGNCLTCMREYLIIYRAQRKMAA